MQVYITLEMSNAWPDSVTAREHLQAAFYVALARGLRERHHLHAHAERAAIFVLLVRMYIYLKFIFFCKFPWSSGWLYIHGANRKRALDRPHFVARSGERPRLGACTDCQPEIVDHDSEVKWINWKIESIFLNNLIIAAFRSSIRRSALPANWRSTGATPIFLATTYLMKSSN